MLGSGLALGCVLPQPLPWSSRKENDAKAKQDNQSSDTEGDDEARIVDEVEVVEVSRWRRPIVLRTMQDAGTDIRAAVSLAELCPSCQRRRRHRCTEER